MAISETSSVKATASKQIKPQTNELMESIKTATLKDTKASFHNLLNNISMKAANQFEERSQMQAQLKNPVKTKDFETADVNRSLKFEKKSTSAEVRDNSLSNDSSDKSDLKTTAPDSQELLNDQQYQGLPLTSTSSTQENQLVKSTSERSVFLTTQDLEIQNWIKDGRVTIEKLSASSRLEQNLPLSSEVMSQLSEFNSPSRLDQGSMSSFYEEVMTNQLMVDSSIQTEADKETKVLNMNLEKTSGDDHPTSASRSNTAQPVTQVMAVAAPLSQDSETATSSFKGKSPNTVMAGQSVEGGAQGRRGGSVQKAATLTTLDKLAALNQIKDQLRQSLRKGETHLNIQLKPNELGKVEIKLDISREGVVSALFKAENRETLEVLNRHSQDFQNLFKDAGLQADSQGMNFSMSQQQQQHETFESNVKVPPIKVSQDSEIEMVSAVPRRPSLASSSVDISV
ncbi:flagellar hook-length control protein FliK [Candidatus Odyssella acanthamoebae]|uniref:Flagellar hook-length control protein-like C-terminal domain-containing protein n=1 Tax=Candidatus Odyssella acanthamoebae TaxID=91604 RepID=A0A077AZ05_9PROT|nr:flagellar hook-length control protein FliK [Candidatus Paracaedibacter acanthamoebae]AIK96868.1 hypothetical protein ID47_09170 [Candidatus Paracaedibacter acanthamoebae]